MTNSSEWRKLAHVVRLTQPIIGIENRTPLEVFDIMCDRIKRSITSTPSPAPEVSELVELLELGGDYAADVFNSFPDKTSVCALRVEANIARFDKACAALAKVKSE